MAFADPMWSTSPIKRNAYFCNILTFLAIGHSCRLG